jgi:hypothetical protein
MRHDPFIDDDVLALWISSRNFDHLGKYPPHATQVADTLCTFQQSTECTRIRAERASSVRVSVRVEHFFR